MTTAELLALNSSLNNTEAVLHLQNIKSLVTDEIELKNEDETVVEDSDNDICLIEDEKTIIIEKDDDKIKIKSEDIINGIC